MAFICEELTSLHSFMVQFNPSSGGASTSSVATAGIPDFALSVSSPTSSASWIIDSSASQHIANASFLFSTSTVSSSQDTVHIANGSVSFVVETGSMLVIV